MKQMNIHLVSTNSMIPLMNRMEVHLNLVTTNTMMILMEKI